MTSMTKMLTTKPRAFALAGLACLVSAVGGISWLSYAAATPPVPPPTAAAPTGVINPDAGTPASPTVSTTARIVFTTVPPAHASVYWGKKLLGRIAPRQALVVVRPRDSGPLDVVVRTGGFLPVQVRAHTFADTRIVVKLTPPELKNTLIGYRAPIDAGAPVEAGEAVAPVAPPPGTLGTLPL